MIECLTTLFRQVFKNMVVVGAGGMEKKYVHTLGVGKGSPKAYIYVHGGWRYNFTIRVLKISRGSAAPPLAPSTATALITQVINLNV